MDSKAADTADTTAVGSTVADSVGAAETTNEAAETATANSTCGARHRHANCCQLQEGERAAGSRGQTSRRPVDAGANVPANSRRTVVLLVMFVAGRGRCSAIAQLVDDVDVAMPAGGYAGGG
jgi:hypothetical protein